MKKSLTSYYTAQFYTALISFSILILKAIQFLNIDQMILEIDYITISEMIKFFEYNFVIFVFCLLVFLFA